MFFSPSFDSPKQLFFFTFIISLLAIQIEGSAQSDSTSFMNQLESELYEHFEVLIDEESEADFAHKLEALTPYLESKIDLNNLIPEVAYYILHFTDYQYYQLQLYIEKFGALVSIYELAAVDGFSEEDAARLYPYLTVSPIKNAKLKFRHFFQWPKHELLLRSEQVLEKKVGYDTSRSNHYKGSPQRLSFRYKLNTKHLSIGFAGEKDAGEQFFRDTQKKGFDHYSFHVNLKNMGIVNSVLLGDFRLFFGQGLIIGSGFLGGKGSGVNGVRSFSSGIQPVNSMNEGDYLRGVAIKLGNVRFSGSLFYGYRCYDGQIDEIENDVFIFDGSLSINGYHRTTSEILKKRTIANHIYGFDFQYQGRIFKMGIRAMRSHFSVDILASETPYKLFDFSGNNYYNVAMDYQSIVGKTILFGEIGISRKWKIGLLQGAIFHLDPRVKMSALFRYYPPHFIALMGSSFRENSKLQNETGLYLASDVIVNAKMEIGIFYDVYYFKWLRYQVDKPSMGMDFGTRCHIGFNRKANMELKYLFRKKEKNGGENGFHSEIIEINRHKARVTMNYVPFSKLKLKSQVDYICNINDKTTKKNGVLIFQDVALTISKIKTDIKLRVAFFDTDSYEERLYAYENDLYYVFNITGYYYKGWRAYLVLKYQYRFFSLWFRISQTYYIDRKEISSGLEMIDKPHKTEIKLQLLFKL